MIETHKLNMSPENQETASLNGKIQFLNSEDPLYNHSQFIDFEGGCFKGRTVSKTLVLI